jgi:hypothetical protein
MLAERWVLGRHRARRVQAGRGGEHLGQGFRRERLKGLEPSTFCMAKRNRQVRFSNYGGFPYGAGSFFMACRDGFGTRVVLH